jgi:hypothetical protein
MTYCYTVNGAVMCKNNLGLVLKMSLLYLSVNQKMLRQATGLMNQWLLQKKFAMKRQEALLYVQSITTLLYNLSQHYYTNLPQHYYTIYRNIIVQSIKTS